MKTKQELLDAFLNNLKTKSFKDSVEYDFWKSLAPSLDEQVLMQMNQDIIDENLKGLNK